MLKFKSANLAEATVFEAPIKALLFLVPFIALIFTGLLTMGATDTIFVLRWVIVLLALNLSVLPLRRACSVLSAAEDLFSLRPLVSSLSARSSGP